MPGHKVHDAVALVFIVGVVAGAVIGEYLDIVAAGLACVAFVVSSFVLSPDMDLESRIYHRWGPLRWLWWPYMRSVGHRSWFSHGPVLGTLARVSYLLLLLSPVAAVLVLQGVVAPAEVIVWLRGHVWDVVAVLGGVEAGTLVHLALDKTLKN